MSSSWWTPRSYRESCKMISGSCILEVNQCEYRPLHHKGSWYGISYCYGKSSIHVNWTVLLSACYRLSFILEDKCLILNLSQVSCRERCMRVTWLVSFAVTRWHSSFGFAFLPSFPTPTPFSYVYLGSAGNLFGVLSCAIWFLAACCISGSISENKNCGWYYLITSGVNKYWSLR